MGKRLTVNKLAALIGIACGASFAAADAPQPAITSEEPSPASPAKSTSTDTPTTQRPLKPFRPFRKPADSAAAVALLADGPGLAAGSFLLFPEVVLRQTYDSNIFAAATDDVSDSILTPSLALAGRSDWARHKVDFSVDIDSDLYRRHSTQDTNDYWLEANGRFDLSPGNNLFGGLRHGKNHEDRGTSDVQLGLDPTVYHSTHLHLGGAFASGPWSVRLGGSAENLDYRSTAAPAVPGVSNNDDRDQLQHSLGARIGYRLSPAWMPFVQLATDTRDYRQSSDDYGFRRSSDGYRASLGAAWNGGAALNGEAFVGHLVQRYDDSRFSDVSRPYFGASLTWKPRPTTRVHALLDRALQETTIPGAAGFLDTSVALDAEHAIGPRMVANARVSHSWNAYHGIDRLDKLADAQAGIRYYFEPALYLGVGMQLTNRDSSVTAANYYRNQLMISLGYAPGRKPRTTGGTALEQAFVPAAGGLSEVRGVLAPKLAYFDNSGNAAYANRYDPLRQTFGDAGSHGPIADLDFSLTYGGRHDGLLRLEREGFGRNGERMHLEGSGASTRLTAYYGSFATASGTLGYLYNPDRVAGGTDPRYADPALNTTGESTHVGYFTNDTPGVSDFSIRRTGYGGSLALKPAALSDSLSIELGFDGYKRKGTQVANYVLDNYSLTGATKEQHQWRGYALPIDEQTGQLTYNLTFAPLESWLLNYEFSLGKFENNAKTLTFNSLAQLVPSIPFDTGVVDMNTPLRFTPDSTQYSNSLRLSRNFGDVAAFSGGFNISRLEQNSFSAVHTSMGYSNGQTDTQSWYVTGRFNPHRTVGIEAFVRYSQRDNNSTYPVAGFYEPVSANYADPRMVMPRIDKARKLTYGVEAKLYPGFLKTSWSAGWTHEEKSNDLTYGVVPALAPPIMLYGERYAADELYLKMVSRPARGWVLRVTPSYLWAKETQLVSDPKEMFKLRTSLAYTKPEWHELAVTGYYNFKYKKNDSLRYSDYSTALGFNAPQEQKATSRTQAAGVNMNLAPSEGLTLNLGYDWAQNDLSASYFTTNRMRFDYPLLPSNPHPLVPLDFLILDRTRYDIDNHTITASFEKQWHRYLLAGSYSVNWTRGHTADGLAGEPLPTVDGKVDNLMHTLSFGAEYAWKTNTSVRAVFIHDRYQDKLYGALDGSRNTLWVGLNFRL